MKKVKGSLYENVSNLKKDHSQDNSQHNEAKLYTLLHTSNIYMAWSNHHHHEKPFTNKRKKMLN
jgi:hypothetical protein